MPEKKSTGRKGAAPESSVVPPASMAHPPAAEAKPAEALRPLAATPEPDAKPVATTSAAARILTKSLVVKKAAAARGDTQRVADATKPSQKPVAGGGRRGPRRGASKGR